VGIMGSIAGLDLFSGAGGFTLGLKQAGVVTLGAVEKEPYRAQTFALHTPNANLIQSDIQKVDLSVYRGKVDLVYGGPPCQPFSSGGRRLASQDDRDMIPEYVKAIERVNPFAFLMENVPGLSVGERGSYLSSVLQAFRDLGYRVSWKVINAADFGVPQKRRRLFVVGMKDREFIFPEETHGKNRRWPHVSVRDVLPMHQVGTPNTSKVFYAKNPDTRPSPYDGHVFNGGGRAINRNEPCHTLLASAGGNKTHFFDDLNLVPEYHRHLMAGGKPRVGELLGARRLTVEESATIQTFPPDVVFVGPRSAHYHQIGDAVPPLLATALGKSLVNQMIRTYVEKTETKVQQPVQGSLAL
jgi:DNA (cytosine-5)-methyltransferase 1